MQDYNKLFYTKPSINDYSSPDGFLSYFLDKIDSKLVTEALTHKSFSYENLGTSNNERLEFLGDSVLQIVTTTKLYETYPNEPEGFLAKKRASLVSEISLAYIAKKIGLGEHIKLGKGEAKTNGHTKPSILSDTLEAVFGAIFLDKGIAEARDHILNLLEFVWNNPEVSENSADPKTRVQELVASKKLGTIVYTIEQSGKDHAPIFFAKLHIGGEFFCKAKGLSKKKAEMSAAAEAIKLLEKI